MLDRNLIGTKLLEPVTVTVSAIQLALFAKAIGETNPVFFDEKAAKAAGHRSIPAPPTFAFALNNVVRPEPFTYLQDFGVDMGKILHAEQRFEYVDQIYCGDTLTLHETITDIYDKKGGALQFLVIENPVMNQNGECVLKMTSNLAIRHEVAA